METIQQRQIYALRIAKRLSLVTARRPIFFCHIPKTGGTTLRRALEEAFKPRDILPTNKEIAESRGYPSIESLTPKITRRSTERVLVRGHYPYAVHTLLQDPVKIVVLRDPLSRRISQIKHMIARTPQRKSTIVDALNKGRPPFADNAMTRMLCGDPIAPWQRPIEPYPATLPASSIIGAIDALKSTDILGVTERMDLLEEPLADIGVSFKASTKLNPAAADIKLTPRQIDLLKEHDRLDWVVYETAKEILSLP